MRSCMGRSWRSRLAVAISIRAISPGPILPSVSSVANRPSGRWGSCAERSVGWKRGRVNVSSSRCGSGAFEAGRGGIHAGEDGLVGQIMGLGGRPAESLILGYRFSMGVIARVDAGADRDSFRLLRGWGALFAGLYHCGAARRAFGGVAAARCRAEKWVSYEIPLRGYFRPGVRVGYSRQSNWPLPLNIEKDLSASIVILQLCLHEGCQFRHRVGF